MIYKKITLKWGNVIGGVNSDGNVVGLWFEGQKHFPKIPADAIWQPNTTLFQGVFEAMETQLHAYENGTLKTFDLPLNPKGTAFQNLIWKLLKEIPFGETRTYGALAVSAAEVMNKPSMSAQAVGQAVGRNPISVIIPCHRILGAKGALTGYAGGIEKKMALLRHEQII